MVAGQDLVIPVSLGAGDLAATGINTIHCGVNEWYKSAKVTFTDNKVTIPSSMIDYLVSTSKSYEITILFNDTANTSVTVALKMPSA